MDAVSTLERAKYEKMWALPAYRDDDATAHAHAALAALPMRPGDSVIDFGAGAGYASLALLDAGFRVLAVDLAANALAPHIAARVPVLLASLWDLPVALAADWGFCSDVMEHVPTNRVDDVLRTIRTSTRRATYFSISLRPDGCGVLIGEALHLTVRPLAWWVARLQEQWPVVRVLRHAPGDRAVCVVGDARDVHPEAAPPIAGAVPSVRPARRTERAEALLQRVRAAGVTACLIFGSGEVGRAMAAAARRAGVRVIGFVQSAAPAPGATIDGLPLYGPDDAAAGGCHTYVIGSFGSAPAILAMLERTYAPRTATYAVFVPDGPAPR
jgi:Methyltransferase domain